MVVMVRCFGMLLGLAGATLLGVVLLVTILLAPFASGIAPAGTMGSLVLAAQVLQAHLFGLRANTYDLNDPVIQPVYRFWVSSCGSHGVICPEAVSGNLQCVEFVTGAFFLAGEGVLPAIGNGVDFWPLYAHRAGWSEIPATEAPSQLRGLPLPGDMMVWKGGEFGHVAIVIAVVPPLDGHEGSVTVAQANAPGNRWPASHGSDPGNWYTMPLHPDLSVGTWAGYTVRGYIRQHSPSSATTATTANRLAISLQLLARQMEKVITTDIDRHSLTLKKGV